MQELDYNSERQHLFLQYGQQQGLDFAFLAFLYYEAIF